MDDETTRPSPVPRATTAAITVLLGRAHAGEKDAFDQLMEIVHQELQLRAERLMKSEADGHTLQPSALVNEACLRLMQPGALNNARNRRYLFKAANEAMRRVLVDHARGKKSAKRGGSWKSVPLDTVLENLRVIQGISILDLHDVLETLKLRSEIQYEIVMHKFFGGKTVEDISELLELSRDAVKLQWRLARVWLHERLSLDE